MNAGERQVMRRARAILRGIPAAQTALELLRSLDQVPARRVAEDEPQLELELRELDPDTRIDDCPLRCTRGLGVTAVVCVARQLVSEAEVGGPSATQRKRGRVGTFVQCRTQHCAVGQHVRRVLGDIPRAVEMARRAPGTSDAWNIE